MRYSRLTATLAATALTLAACGGGSDSNSTTTGAGSTAGSDTMAETTTGDSMADGAGTDTMAETTAGVAAGGTIVDVAASNPDFSTLVAAVQAAGLADTLNGAGPFTVLAPTNEAFDAALTDLGMTADELLANTDLLTKVLTYHVIAGEVPSATVATMNGQEVPTVNGATVKITVDGDKIMVNDANVIAPDVAASNGVIHAIDKVLLPPTDGDAMPDGDTTATTDASADANSGDAGSDDANSGNSGAAVTDNLMEVAAANPDFSILVQATGKAGLFQTLAVEGPFTVFAPTNAAFEQALTDLNMTADELFADTELLKKILTYHVVAGSYPAADVAGLNGTEVPTVEGSPVTITVDGDKVMVNDANVTTADVMASNGVIHVIDKVLLPPTD